MAWEVKSTVIRRGSGSEGLRKLKTREEIAMVAGDRMEGASEGFLGYNGREEWQQ